MRVAIGIGLLLFGLGLPMQGQQLRWLTHSSGRPVKAYAVSGNGQVVVGFMPFYVTCPPPEEGPYYTETAFRWIVSSDRVQDLFAGWDCEAHSNPSVAFGISFSGDVIGGVAWGGGFRWEAEVQGFTYWYDDTVFGVSGDGRVVVGGGEEFYRRQAFRHVWGQSVERLGTLGGDRSAALDASYDGSVVVGRAKNAEGNWRAFRWTAASGRMKDLNITYAALLTPGSVLVSARAISPDGRYIVGYGINAATGRYEGFLLDTVPEPASMLALGVGLAGLVGLKRRKR